MARLVTEYDNKVGKVFKLRGDEQYARTTDCVLTVTDGTTDVNGYNVSVSANIMRDLGNSHLTLYNGETALKLVDTASGTSATSIGSFKFNWGVSNELYARFDGNHQCLGCKSKKVIVQKPIPSEYKTAITYNSTSQISSGADYSLSVSVTIGGEITTGCYSTPIYIYVDDELWDDDPILTGESSNTATATISGLSDGEHTIRAVIYSSQTINEASATHTVAVGYNIQISETPVTFVSGASNTIKATVFDYNGSPVASQTVSLSDNGATATTNSNGVATFTRANTNTSIYAYIGENKSDTVTLNYFTPSGITTVINNTIMSGNPSIILDDGETRHLRFVIEGVQSGLANSKENIPVTITDINGTSHTEYTDNKGGININYVGNHRGAKSISASIGSYHKGFSIKETYYYTLNHRPLSSIEDIYYPSTVEDVISNGTYRALFDPDGFITFDTRAENGDPFEFAFITSASGTNIKIGLSSNKTDIDSTTFDNDLLLERYNTIKIVRDSSSLKLYVNDSLISSTSAVTLQRYVYIKFSTLWLGSFYMMPHNE